MISANDILVRIKALGFAGRIGLLDYVEKKSESHNGWNYSVLVYATEAMDIKGSDYYFFSRDELEFIGDHQYLNSIMCSDDMEAESAQERYTACQFDASIYVVYDRVEEKEICICAKNENGDLPEMRAKLVAEALNTQRNGP